MEKPPGLIEKGELFFIGNAMDTYEGYFQN